MNDKWLWLFKEPLAQFLLIGVAIYGLYGFFGTPESVDSEHTITVTSGEVEALAAQWSRLWSRAPTEEELAGVVREYARVQILSSEAIAIGLDEGDTVIQRRLAQKLQFLSDSLNTPEEPTLQQLTEWYAANSEKFKQPDLYTLTHVFFDPDKRGSTVLDEAESLRDQLNAMDVQPDSFSEYGDALMLQSHYQQWSVAELSKVFGSGFVDTVTGLEPGQWFAPVLSGYGVHVVKLNDHWIAPDPDFGDVEEQVRQEFIAARAEELSNSFIENLLSRYEIVIEESSVALTVPVNQAGS